MLLVLLLFFFCCSKFNNASITFGIETPTSNKSIYWSTANITDPYDFITLTLYWSTAKYECDIYPTKYDTFYYCDSSHTIGTSFDCDASSNLIEYGLQINADEYSEILEIDRVIITDPSNIYTIEMFCVNKSDSYFNDSDSEIHCLHGGYDILQIDYDYKLIILDFINESSAYVTNINPTYSDLDCSPIGCTISDDPIIKTIDYGAGYISDSILNQGIIKGINSWSIQVALDSIAKFSFINGSNITSKIYGISGTVYTCNSFILSDNEYINGYRVIYSDSYVHGLTFYTNNGSEYSCCSNSSHLYSDTNKIIYDGYYLSGFWMQYGSILNTISFQFTKINNTYNNSNCSVLNNYILIEEAMSYYNAQNYCINVFNSTLATILTDDDLQIVKHIRNNIDYSGYDIWIGLNNLNQEGIWKWDGHTGCGYTDNKLCSGDKHWFDGEPNGIVVGQHCAEINYGYNDYFNDDFCIEQNIFLCNNGIYVQDPTVSPTIEPTLEPTYDPTIQPTTPDTIIKTVTYGDTDGSTVISIINQGIIKGISSWSIQVALDSIATFSFINGSNITSKIYGESVTVYQCESFILNNNDYINGYSIIYGKYIHGLILYSKDGDIHECKSNLTDLYNVTNKTVYNGYYLSGFWLKYGSVIDSISFQFTLAPTNNPTINPTINPTNNPTIIPISLTNITRITSTIGSTISLSTIETTHQSSSNSNDNINIVIIICIIISLTIIIVVAMLLLYCYKKSKHDANNAMINKSVEMVNIAIAPGSPKLATKTSINTSFMIDDESMEGDGIILNNQNEDHKEGDHQTKDIINIKLSDDEFVINDIDTDNNDKEKDKVKHWLTEHCGLEQYYDNFVANGYCSLIIIQEMENKSDLLEIGIRLVGHQSKIWSEIKQIRSNNQTNTPRPTKK